jgi:hypothetical protein
LVQKVGWLPGLLGPLGGRLWYPPMRSVKSRSLKSTPGEEGGSILRNEEFERDKQGNRAFFIYAIMIFFRFMGVPPKTPLQSPEGGGAANKDSPVLDSFQESWG